MNPTRHRLVPVGGKVETVCASLEFGAGLGNPLTQALPDLMVILLRDRAPARPWTLEQLAQQSGMSRARFASHFHDVVGITPGNYLTQWRLANAQSLLRQGKPVQWVSDTVGYGSASALSRAFRAQLGLSPTEWLNKFK